jgi:3-keto-disaccharide hydrolase
MRGWSVRAGAAALLAAGLFWGPGGSPSAAGGKMEVLFNGKNLDGWYTFLEGAGKNSDPLKVFQVEDGVIHVSGQKFGYLSTVKEYGNFRLSVDFRWGEKKWPPRENAPRDAGVLYHCTGPDQVWVTCMECQVQEKDTGDMWLIPGMTTAPSVVVQGKTYGGTKAYTRVVKFADHEKPHGEWNTVVVVARGDHVEHWINGKMNMAGDQASVTRGRINLQSEGAEIYYRNIKLEHLE